MISDGDCLERCCTGAVSFAGPRTGACTLHTQMHVHAHTPKHARKHTLDAWTRQLLGLGLGLPKEGWLPRRETIRTRAPLKPEASKEEP